MCVSTPSCQVACRFNRKPFCGWMDGWMNGWMDGWMKRHAIDAAVGAPFFDVRCLVRVTLSYAARAGLSWLWQLHWWCRQWRRVRRTNSVTFPNAHLCAAKHRAYNSAQTSRHPPSTLSSLHGCLRARVCWLVDRSVGRWIGDELAADGRRKLIFTNSGSLHWHACDQQHCGW